MGENIEIVSKTIHGIGNFGYRATSLVSTEFCEISDELKPETGLWERIEIFLTDKIRDNYFVTTFDGGIKELSARIELEQCFRDFSSNMSVLYYSGKVRVQDVVDLVWEVFDFRIKSFLSPVY